MSDVKVGAILGPYRLLTPLGEGGMGIVYRAIHQDTQQVVALKTVRVPHERMLRSIRQEVSALAKLRHPGVVRIIEYGVSPDGLPWYAMEFLEGQTLLQWRADLLANPRIFESKSTSETERTQRLRSHDQLPSAFSEKITSVLSSHHTRSEKGQAQEYNPSQMTSKSPTSLGTLPENKLSEVLDLINYLCHTLAYLHGRGLLHLDLKPQNILVRPDQTPVLVDFGLARRVRRQREKLAVEAGIIGTFAYISPEQLQREPLDARSDLYSLGVLFFELLVGHLPFSGTTPLSWASAHLLTPSPRASDWLSFLPKALDDLLLRLLAKKPQERPGYALDVARSLSDFGSTPQAALPTSHPYLYHPRFSGRETLQTELQAWGKQVRQGDAKQPIVLLSGESGIGKTRFVMKLTERWVKAKQLLLVGECQDTPEPIPLGAFRKSLRFLADHCREKGEEEAERIFGKRGKVLSQYAPFLESLPGQSRHPEPEILPGDIAKLRVYRFLEESLLAYARRKPLLLLLDDLHWADELSLGFLQFFSKGIGRKMGIFGTFRVEETHKTFEFLQSQKEVREVRLGKLTREEITQMVGDMLSLSPPPPVFSRFLYQQSEGNPFFVIEYLRTAVEEERLWRDQDGHWQVATPTETPGEENDYQKLGLPRSLQDLVDRWLSRLSVSGRRLLEVAALIGREVPWGVLERAGATDYPALSELFHRQALEERGGNQLRFVHDQLRERTLAKLQSARKPVLHRRVATALEQELAIKGREALLGFHWEKANEVDKAKQYYLKGARDAANTYRYNEAERLYQAYLSLDPLPSSARLEALLELGEDVLHARAKDRDALKVFDQAIEEANTLEDKGLLLLGLLKQGDIYQELGEMDAAHQALTQALSLAKQPKERGMILGSMANLYREQSKNEAAISLYQEALQIMRDTKDRKQEGNLLGNLASLYRRQANHEEAIRCYEEALHIVREIKNRRQEGILLGNFATVLHAQSKNEQTMRLYEEALVIAREIGNRRGEGILLGNIANLYRQQNQRKQAMPLYQEALKISREIGNRKGVGILLGNLASTEHEIGHWEAAERLHHEAFQIAKEIDDFLSQAFSLTNLAFLYYEQRKTKKAKQFSQKALHFAQKTQNRQLEGILLGTLFPVLHSDAGEVEKANDLFSQSLQILQELGDLRHQGMSLVLQAQMERRCYGNFAKSERLLAQAEQILCKELKDRREGAKLFLARGHLLLAQGKSAAFCLAKADKETRAEEISPKSELGRMLSSLARAEKAFQAKENAKLFHGELWEDIPPALKHWLTQNSGG